ncbi:MAG: hypothetical protein PUJ06_04065 [Stecheria intestinalis]|jgi:hypothetical protein|nr:hypothetical protein [Stecheria intestinalis]MDY4681802.1 hypothetical protein [Lachnospiraceae bacterium]
MNEKWSRARCERELKNSNNWEMDFEAGFILQEAFEFYGLSFVRFRIAKAMYPAWGADRHKATGAKWELTGKTYIVKSIDGQAPALEEISKPEAIDLMMEALKDEGFEVRIDADK